MKTIGSENRDRVLHVEGDTSVSFGLLSSFHSPFFYGVLGAILVAVIGNLEGFLEVLDAKGIGPAVFWRWLDRKTWGVGFVPVA